MDDSMIELGTVNLTGAGDKVMKIFNYFIKDNASYGVELKAYLNKDVDGYIWYRFEATKPLFEDFGIVVQIEVNLIKDSFLIDDLDLSGGIDFSSCDISTADKIYTVQYGKMIIDNINNFLKTV